MTLASPLAPLAPRAARTDRAAVALGVLAGVLYNSWPLGFRLDRIGLRGTYISVLEMPGRPNAHVFVACDVLTGMLAVAAGVLLGRARPASGVGLAVTAGLVVFGIGNILEATIPLDATCAASVASCGTGPGAVLAPHDLASLVSLAGLAIALWTLRDRGRWMSAVIALWAATGLFMVVSVVVVRWVTISQASFLIGCGVALAAVPPALVHGRHPAPGSPGPRGLLD